VARFWRSVFLAFHYCLFLVTGLCCGIERVQGGGETHGIVYLISRRQFLDVMLQENGMPLDSECAVDWGLLHADGELEIYPENAYGKLMLLSTLKERPGSFFGGGEEIFPLSLSFSFCFSFFLMFALVVYTFTHPSDVWRTGKQRKKKVKTASAAYLSLIAKGYSGCMALADFSLPSVLLFRPCSAFGSRGAGGVSAGARGTERGLDCRRPRLARQLALQLDMRRTTESSLRVARAERVKF